MLKVGNWNHQEMHAKGFQTLVEANRTPVKWPGVYSSTIGMVFFGTPFRGAGGMDQNTMLTAALNEYAKEQIHIENLNILAPGNEILIELMDTFMETRREKHKTPAACFFEQKRSNVGMIVGGEDRLVSTIEFELSHGLLRIVNPDVPG